MSDLYLQQIGDENEHVWMVKLCYQVIIKIELFIIYWPSLVHFLQVQVEASALQ